MRKQCLNISIISGTEAFDMYTNTYVRGVELFSPSIFLQCSLTLHLSLATSYSHSIVHVTMLQVMSQVRRYSDQTFRQTDRRLVGSNALPTDVITRSLQVRSTHVFLQIHSLHPVSIHDLMTHRGESGYTPASFFCIL